MGRKKTVKQATAKNEQCICCLSDRRVSTPVKSHERAELYLFEKILIGPEKRICKFCRDNLHDAKVDIRIPTEEVEIKNVKSRTLFHVLEAVWRWTKRKIHFESLSDKEIQEMVISALSIPKPISWLIMNNNICSINEFRTINSTHAEILRQCSKLGKLCKINRNTKFWFCGNWFNSGISEFQIRIHIQEQCM